MDLVVKLICIDLSVFLGLSYDGQDGESIVAAFGLVSFQLRLTCSKLIIPQVSLLSSK